ncbi:MAG TPA: PEGA domain-containing protein [Polyangiaceae bacterium]|nr:PEGA domain-containing protein [Polyangiaceae bacterium]
MNAHKLTWSSRSTLVASLALGSALCVPRVAHAEGDEAAETAAARQLAVDGVKLAQADQCSDAVDKLERAEKLKHSPIVLRYLGECQVKVGRWVEGSESLRKLLREPLPENATPALEQAYDSAANTLRDVKPRIPSMRLVVNAPHDADLKLKVDGKDVAATVVGVALPTDPGDHQIEVSAPGFLKATSSVKLAAGASTTVTLELKRDPNAPLAKAAPVPAAAAAPQATSARASEAAPVEHSHVTRALSYVSYGVAAVGLGVGIAFGQSAMSDEKSLHNSCPGRICTPDQQSTLDFAKTKGTISTVGFAVAGGGAALGTILFFTSGDSAPSKNASAAPARSASLHPRAAIGLGNVTVGADF